MSNCGQQIVIKRPAHQHLHTDIPDFDSSVTNIINSTILNSASANWQSVYSTVCSLSAEWDAGGNIDLTVLSANSACWQAACAGNTVFQNNSANYGSVYTVVNSNSANWNYQGTDIKSLSSNWQNTYTIFSTQSANNILIYTNVNSNSSVWNTSFVHLSGDIMTGGLSAPSLSTNTLYVGASTIYFINSGGQVINYLNSQDVLNFRNNFLFTTANSGNWQSVYLTVNDLSSQWAIDLDNSEVNSFVVSNSATILNVDTVVQTNSATWATTTNALYDSAYTTVNANSAINWNYQGTDIKSLTSNWQNTYNKFSTQSANNVQTGTYINTVSSYLNSLLSYPIDEVGEINDSLVLRYGNDIYTKSYLTVRTIDQDSGNNWFYRMMHDGIYVDNDDLGKYIQIKPYEWPTSESTHLIYWPLTAGFLLTDQSTIPGSTNWQNTYTNFSTQSANNLYVYTTVNSNSAVTWNYQGTDIKALTANWQNTCTVYQSNSGVSSDISGRQQLALAWL